MKKVPLAIGILATVAIIITGELAYVALLLLCVASFLVILGIDAMEIAAKRRDAICRDTRRGGGGR